jgi:hypothetical protein
VGSLRILLYSFNLNLAGHSAVLHGCTVEDEAFVGMGATLLDGVYVEKYAMVAAGALVRQNARIPCGEVCPHPIHVPGIWHSFLFCIILCHEILY